MRWLPRLAVLAVAAVAATAASAQEAPPLVTDRPDQSESAVTVPPGYVQLESGLLWAEDEAGGVEVESLAAGSSLLRVGLADRIELRLGWNGWVEESIDVAGGGGARLDGAGDAGLGVKVELAPERAGRPAAALLVGTTVPTGARGLSSERFDPSLRLAFGQGLTERLSLSYNLGVAWSTSDDGAGDRDTLARGAYTLTLGAAAGERTGVFVELFGDVGLSDPAGAAHLFDAGVTHLVRPHLQLDAAVGVGLNDAAGDLQVGVGVSWRWPR